MNILEGSDVENKEEKCEAEKCRTILHSSSRRRYMESWWNTINNLSVLGHQKRCLGHRSKNFFELQCICPKFQRVIGCVCDSVGVI